MAEAFLQWRCATVLAARRAAQQAAAAATAQRDQAQVTWKVLLSADD